MDQIVNQEPTLQSIVSQPSIPDSNTHAIRKIVLAFLIVITIGLVSVGSYFLGKNQQNTSRLSISPTPAITQEISPTIAPISSPGAMFAPKDTSEWKRYDDANYSFFYPPAWKIKTFTDPYHDNKEQITLEIPYHSDIQAVFGPNPHGNPGGGGGPEVPTFLNNTIPFIYQGKQQALNESITLLGAEKRFSKAILDQIQLNTVKDLDSSFITYQPSMNLGQYYDLRNTFLTLLQTLTIK